MVFANPGSAKSLNAAASTSANWITGRQNFPTSPNAISCSGRSPNRTQPPSLIGSLVVSRRVRRAGAAGGCSRVQPLPDEIGQEPHGSEQRHERALPPDLNQIRVHK